MTIMGSIWALAIVGTGETPIMRVVEENDPPFSPLGPYHMDWPRGPPSEAWAMLQLRSSTEVPRMVNESRPNTKVSFENLVWFDCRVDRVGPGEDGTIWIALTDRGGKFTEQWFVALPTIRQEVLQTALAAVQNDLVCRVALTGTGDDGEVYRIHAIKD